MKPQLELRVKAHLRRTIIIPNAFLRCGSQQNCVTLSKRLEHPEKTNPMPEFSDRAADGTRALWSQSSGPGAPSCTFSGRRMTGAFQSPGFYSRRLDVAFILFTWVGFNLTQNGFDAQSKCKKKKKRLNRIEDFIIIRYYPF